MFDKTGTLTHATPTVVDVVPFVGRNTDDVLRIAACLEEHYPHSMANAVVQAAASKGISHEEMHSEVQYVVAHGIASSVGGEKVVIGSQHFVFEDEGCYIPTSESDKFDALPPQYSHLYLAIDGELAGVICIADPLRKEAADVGIAISDGAAIAREIADMTVAADSLNELVVLKRIANGLQKRTHANYRFIMGFNGTLIVLGAMGILQPATSALLHNASTLGVSLKSMTNLLDEYK